MEPQGEDTHCVVIGKFALAHAIASGLGSATATNSALGAEYATCQTLHEQGPLYQFRKNKAHVGRMSSPHPANTEDTDAKLSCRITLRDRRDGHCDNNYAKQVGLGKTDNDVPYQLYIPKSRLRQVSAKHYVLLNSNTPST